MKTGAHKLEFSCTGTQRIEGVKSPLVFEVVESLEVNKKIVHPGRLILYRSSMDGDDVSARIFEADKHNEQSY